VPVPPYSDVRPGVAAQDIASSPGEVPEPAALGARVAYQPQHQHFDATPQTYVDSPPQQGFGERPEPPRGQEMQCVGAPTDWKDKRGFDCSVYESNYWCTTSGTTTNSWPSWWGAIEENSGEAGFTALQACCACGGGQKTLVVTKALTPLDQRSLVASGDTIPFKYPESLPYEREEDARATQARQDYIPKQYSRYFDELHVRQQEPDPLGLSARFYSHPAQECSAYIVSQIDRGLDYRKGAGGSRKRLDEIVPTKLTAFGGYSWGLWTGSINIFTGGLYTFELKLGFNTNSSLEVDAQNLVTFGQCTYGQNENDCTRRGCVWLTYTEVCLPFLTSEDIRKEEAAERSQKASPLHSLSLLQQNQGLPKFPSAQAPAPATVTADSSSSSSSSSSSEGASSSAPAQAPAAAASPEASASAPAASGMAPGPFASVPSPAPAPAPAPSSAAPGPSASGDFGGAPSPGAAGNSGPTQDGWNGAGGGGGGGQGPFTPADNWRRLLSAGKQPNQIDLVAGPHCIQIMVGLSPTAGTIQLRYSGPDTEGVDSIVPGKVLYCDPVIPACARPALDACAVYKPDCSAAEAGPPPPPPPPPPLEGEAPGRPIVPMAAATTAATTGFGAPGPSRWASPGPSSWQAPVPAPAPAFAGAPFPAPAPALAAGQKPVVPVGVAPLTNFVNTKEAEDEEEDMST